MASKLDLALAQFIGFKHCKNNPDDSLGLVISMGLKKYEWIKLKIDNIETLLDENEIKGINEYFEK